MLGGRSHSPEACTPYRCIQDGNVAKLNMPSKIGTLILAGVPVKFHEGWRLRTSDHSRPVASHELSLEGVFSTGIVNTSNSVFKPVMRLEIMPRLSLHSRIPYKSLKS